MQALWSIHWLEVQYCFFCPLLQCAENVPQTHSLISSYKCMQIKSCPKYTSTSCKWWKNLNLIFHLKGTLYWMSSLFSNCKRSIFCQSCHFTPCSLPGNTVLSNNGGKLKEKVDVQTTSMLHLPDSSGLNAC